MDRGPIGPRRCWAQHDYLTIGPNKMSDEWRGIAVDLRIASDVMRELKPSSRHNFPIAREWIAEFGGRLSWREPLAGAIALGA